MTKPKITNSLAEQEINKAEENFDAFEKSVKDLTLDRMSSAPVQEVEPQTKLSQDEISKSKDVYLKPLRAIGAKEKFNEKFRESWEFSKEYVQFIAEHREIIGENIEIWTKPYPGVACEYWEVPTNKPIWGPRYLAEQIKSKTYHRLKTENSFTGSQGMGQFYGSMVVDTVVQRLDAIPVAKRKSLFMGANAF